MNRLELPVVAPLTATSSAKRGQIIHKRPHRKVRTGCIECKSRKIKSADGQKCNEGRPQCALCKRYSTSCIYPTSRDASASSSQSPVNRDVTSSQPPLEELQLGIPKDLSDQTTDLQVESLELLHHWTTYAYHGFGDKPEDRIAWQVDIPQIACKQPFLMRGILAVSALHMSHVRPEQRQKYLVLAVHHQNLALPSYRYVIDDFRNKMTEENCHAVIGFASLTSAYAFADPHPLGSTAFAGVSPRTGVPEWLLLLRGARQILNVGRDWIAKGPMAFQLRTVPPGEIDLTYNPDDARLAALEDLFDRKYLACHISEEDTAVYRTTLRLLRETFAIPFLPHQILGVKLSMFTWAEHIPQRYLELLGDLKPQALILLAHFCVLLEEGGAHYWYMEGAAKRLISALHGVLDDEWKPWITWPLEKVNIIDV